MDTALPASAVESKTILIDAGHGFDAGASNNGISEKDINLNVAKNLKCLIEKRRQGSMTREDDVSTADPENQIDGSSAKKSDLRRRREMITESGADMFVSVHMNKFPQPECWEHRCFAALSRRKQASRRMYSIRSGTF